MRLVGQPLLGIRAATGLLLVAVFAMLAASCAAPLGAGEALPTPGIDAAGAATEAPPAPTATEEDATRRVLTVWVPPQFGLEEGGRGAGLLLERLTAFGKANPDYEVSLRVKASSGPGGLLETLVPAAAVAPRLVPSLILLTHPQLESAASQGLLQPLDRVTPALQDEDWLAPGIQLATVGGNTYGLPMAMDALLAVYRLARAPSPPKTWSGLFAHGAPVIFPGADPLAALAFDLYLSQGGRLQDDQGRPVLEEEALLAVLDLYAKGVASGSFPAWVGDLATDEEAWQAYRDQRGHWLVTWSSQYFGRLPTDSLATPLPGLGGEPFALADGWFWALSDPLPERQSVALELARHLTAPDFLVRWSPKSGCLPVRGSSLEGWPNQTQRELATRLLASAHVPPHYDALQVLGPPLRDAGREVIQKRSNPLGQAGKTIERIKQEPLTP